MAGQFSFHFSLGDSGTGPIGLCARVIADDRDEAVKKLKERLADALGAGGSHRLDGGGEEYVEVYINLNAITEDAIDEEEEVEEDEELDEAEA